MGASGWHYLVPYQDDVAQALEELRHAVYNSGDFYREEPDATHALTEEQFIAQLDPAGDALGINEFPLDQWREAQQRPRPVDPDTLFQSQPHSGTHSIIDMAHGVSTQPSMFTASPLTPQQLLESFATTTPTDQQTLAWAKRSGYSQYRTRWEGVYVVSHDAGGQPDQILFTGYSGD
jgi:hypothetical protein